MMDLTKILIIVTSMSAAKPCRYSREFDCGQWKPPSGPDCNRLLRTGEEIHLFRHFITETPARPHCCPCCAGGNGSRNQVSRPTMMISFGLAVFGLD